MSGLSKAMWVLVSAVAIAGVARAHGVSKEPSPPDDDARERLIRKIEGGGEEDVMTRIIRGMDRCEQRLADRFDTGEQTQEIQEAVLKEIDTAIAMAKQNLRKGKPSPQPKSDQRDEGEAGENKKSEEQLAKGDEASQDDTTGKGEDVEAGKSAEMREHRRSWGNLPPRDRAEIIQGMNEEFSERYRKWIERYFESLGQDEAESKPRGD